MGVSERPAPPPRAAVEPETTIAEPSPSGVQTEPCQGHDRAIFDGEPLGSSPAGATTATHHQDHAGRDHINVKFTDPDPDALTFTWLRLDLARSDGLDPSDFPLELDLGALPRGWQVELEWFQGTTETTDSGGVLWSDAWVWFNADNAVFDGYVQVSGAQGTVSLCLTARGGSALRAGAAEAFMYVDAIAIDGQ